MEESEKWDGTNRVVLESSAMRSNGNEPQSAHYDCKYKWVDSDKGKTMNGRQAGDKLDKSGYPLSVLIPVTQDGMYIQVWDPGDEGYGYILHVKFGEVVFF